MKSSNICKDVYRLIVLKQRRTRREMKIKIHENIMKSWKMRELLYFMYFMYFMSYVIIVNKNKTKVVHFVYTPDIMSRASLHIRCSEEFIIVN